MPVRCLGADFGALVWLGLLAFRLWGRVRGVWGVFLLGKNNSLRSDIFFPARKIPHTPLPTGSTGIPRKKQREHPEIGVNVALVPIRHKNTAAVISRLPANARRRGVAVGFFAGKRCLSEASCFSKKIQQPPRKPARTTGRLGAQAKPCPRTQQARSPTQGRVDLSERVNFLGQKGHSNKEMR